MAIATASTPKTTIGLVDDHRLFLEALTETLNTSMPEVEALPFSDCAAALARIDSDSDLDLLLVDLSMPNMDGFSFIEKAALCRRTVPIVAVSALSNPVAVARALHAGAIGFIPKTMSKEETIEAIRAVIKRGEFLPDDIRAEISQLTALEIAGARLSARQLDVLRLLADGLSNQEISEQLFISNATVKTHVRALMTEFGVNSRTQCVVQAMRAGLVVAD